ncbi:hypothetical protein L598_002600000530 [Mesorhizobium sp. J18]|nr:hypothetical protein L598_002600000530 [Mesorhizobium sp. J18]
MFPLILHLPEGTEPINGMTCAGRWLCVRCSARHSQGS